MLLAIAFFGLATLIQGRRKYHELTTDEERVSALAFAKTMTFFGLSFVAGVLGFMLWAVGMISAEQLALGAAAAALPILIAALVIREPMQRHQLPAVSERNLALGFSVLAFIPWIFSLDAATFRLIKVTGNFGWWHFCIDGLLFVLIMVFFVMKSVLSRKLRYGVLAVAAVPLVNLIVGLAWPRS